MEFLCRMLEMDGKLEEVLHQAPQFATLYGQFSELTVICRSLALSAESARSTSTSAFEILQALSIVMVLQH